MYYALIQSYDRNYIVGNAPYGIVELETYDIDKNYELLLNEFKEIRNDIRNTDDFETPYEYRLALAKIQIIDGIKTVEKIINKDSEMDEMLDEKNDFWDETLKKYNNIIN